MLLHTVTTTTFKSSPPPPSLPLLIRSTSRFPIKPSIFPRNPKSIPLSWRGKLGFGNRATNPTTQMDSSASDSVALGPDDDIPSPGLEFAAGCFWGVELGFQRVPGVIVTEVGYTQGVMDNPTYEDVCTDETNHSEVVRLQYDPRQCSFHDLLNAFWAKHDPTSVNRQKFVDILSVLAIIMDMRDQRA
ncbi:hypothetical protein QJS10_CPA10g00999 [Acorus calamus]|uniref:peptide-methionine (S)-S-oxide reductase n=1 Tax=Acorus calamus TaxID=4465 RepID=A0AAV9DY35_ACOCL|nr:hypothetical protein QJS10_CPA10g00999 [Acorus calamus]